MECIVNKNLNGHYFYSPLSNSTCIYIARTRYDEKAEKEKPVLEIYKHTHAHTQKSMNTSSLLSPLEGVNEKFPQKRISVL
jgi:hypothetical protein